MSADFALFLKAVCLFVIAFGGLLVFSFTEYYFWGAVLLGIAAAILLEAIAKGLVRGAVRTGIDEARRHGK